MAGQQITHPAPLRSRLIAWLLTSGWKPAHKLGFWLLWRRVSEGRTPEQAHYVLSKAFHDSISESPELLAAYRRMQDAK